ncbi:MAG: AAA family ATPase [Myxococcota bacterium]
MQQERQALPLTLHIVLSGCSGGGKSTLLHALAQRGYATVPEPGRRIVRQALQEGRTQALPWIDPEAFCRRAAAMAAADLQAASAGEVTFFDRSVVDAAAYFERAKQPMSPDVATADQACRYDAPVFMVPPWPELFVTDDERRHSFQEAKAEYHALMEAYRSRGYPVVVLPKSSVAERVESVLSEMKHRYSRFV